MNAPSLVECWVSACVSGSRFFHSAGTDVDGQFRGRAGTPSRKPAAWTTLLSDVGGDGDADMAQAGHVAKLAKQLPRLLSRHRAPVQYIIDS